MNRSTLLTVAVALSLATAGCAGILGDSTDAATPGGGAEPTTQGAQPADNAAPGGIDGEFTAPTIDAHASASNYTALYDDTIDSVVEIRTETARGGGTGSGFVYHGDGLIVTNQHVVADAEEVSVGFASGVWREGTVVGSDVYTDLAVVQVDSLPDASTPLALSDGEPEPGQPVAAIGSPLGYQGTITHGIVSGTNRSMPVEGDYSIPDTVQTDAAINPGNSGGPLVAMNGAVVGVNRAKAGDNVGFAVSADVASRVLPHLVENGSYDHSFMGIRTVPVTPDVAAANDLERARGVMIVAVLQGGPADGALQVAERTTGPDDEPVPVGGDVVVAVEDRSINSQHALARYLLLHTGPGERIEVTVLRDGDRITETITLGERPDPRSRSGV